MEVNYKDEQECKALIRELVVEARESKDDPMYASIVNNTAMILMNCEMALHESA